MIVLEEEVIAGPDLLAMMAQCLAAVDADDTLIGISAWNVNGTSPPPHDVISGGFFCVIVIVTFWIDWNLLMSMKVN